MDSLHLLIPLAVLLVAFAVRLLFWAVKSGQYDDLDTEGRRILFDNSDQPATPAGGTAADAGKGNLSSGGSARSGRSERRPAVPDGRGDT